MITNKDISIENGNIILNGDKYPLDGQSPETIMGIVKDNSDTTPTENSTAPITSGGVYTALEGKQDYLTVVNSDGNLNYSGHYYAHKYGRVVNLQISGVVNATLNESMSLTSSLPLALRPLFNVNAVGYYADTDFDAANNGVNFRIAPNGIISTHSYKAFTSGTLSVTYIAAE